MESEQLPFLDALTSHLKEGRAESEDLFGVVKRMLKYYQTKEGEGKFFGETASSHEVQFFRCLLGIAWTWIRLILLKNQRYDQEAYDKELTQFVDVVELEHHQTNQCSVETIAFTLSALQYV